MKRRMRSMSIPPSSVWRGSASEMNTNATCMGVFGPSLLRNAASWADRRS
jgi:hypothetical protein